MFFRRFRSVNFMDQRNRYPFKDKDGHIIFLPAVLNTHFKYSLYFFLFLSVSSVSLFFCFPATEPATPFSVCNRNVSVYLYELPAKFNLGLLQDCRHLSVHTDMCPHVLNRGLGQPLVDMGGFSWFATNQFTAEMIFHARVEKHPCRTLEPNEADLFYVPFYGGLHTSSKFRESDLAVRDRLAIELAEYMSQQPWWQRNHGRDHFLALGRIAKDFMRKDGRPGYGANCLLNLPQVKNMSVLTVERDTWEGSNQHGIPYPSYFHPNTKDELLMWQDKMRQSSRPHLFSFVGAPRTGSKKAMIRDKILRQCAESTRCHLLECKRRGSNSKCNDPSEVLQVMTGSQFCMQAPGDSFTRRSTFDSVLAGCIPVFFSPHSAYSQYNWYLPTDPSEYSVYIPEKNASRIEEELLKIPIEKVERMRSTVIDLIPRLTYVHPNATDIGFQDVVDVALEQLTKHVQSNT